jgi:predicted dehydrogenase
MMANADAIEVGVVGLGKIAQLMHLHYAAQLSEVRVAAVCDLSRELAEAVGSAAGVPRSRIFTDVDDLLAQPLDAVLVLNVDHGPLVLRALQARRHVFVEKPLCWSIHELGAIREAVADSRCVLAVGYMRRSDAAVESALTRVVAEREKVLFARVHNFGGGRQRRERLYPVLKGALPEAEKAKHEAELRGKMVASLGTDDPRRVALFRTLMELCSHDLNLLHAALGPIDSFDAAYAADPGLFLARTSHGDTRCTLEVLPLFDSVRDWDHQIAFYSDSATIELQFANPFVRNAPTRILSRCADPETLEESEAVVIVSYESPFAVQLRRFASLVRGDANGLPGVEDAARDLEALVALAREAELT